MLKNQNYSRYLTNKNNKKLIAFGLMIDQKQIFEGVLINPANMDDIDIVLETFSFEIIVYEYYKKMLANTNRRVNF